jgi:hypothetical protein
MLCAQLSFWFALKVILLGSFSHGECVMDLQVVCVHLQGGVLQVRAVNSATQTWYVLWQFQSKAIQLLQQSVARFCKLRY